MFILKNITSNVMLFFTEVVLEQKNRNDWGEIAKEFRKQTCIVLTNVSKWKDVDTDPTINETLNTSQLGQTKRILCFFRQNILSTTTPESCS